MILEVEAEVAAAGGQPAGQARHGLLQEPWRAVEVQASPGLGQEGLIAGEELVAAIPAQRDGYLPAGKGGKEIGGHYRSVGEGLVEKVGHRGQDLEQGAGLQPFFVMHSPEQAGHPARMAALVKRRFGESHREGVDIARPSQVGGQRRHR